MRGWGQQNRPDYDDHGVATKRFRKWDVSDSKSTQNSGQHKYLQNFSNIQKNRFANDHYISLSTNPTYMAGLDAVPVYIRKWYKN